MKHTLPPLPFDIHALEPHISARTLEIHHGKHHKAYVDKLNQLASGTKFADMTLLDTIRHSEGPIFNNAAQAWNHTFYWNCLTPKSRKPGGRLGAAIEREFDSFENFQQEFTNAAVSHFGSGWAWLMRAKSGQLHIKTTSNADTPVRWGAVPLLVVDVWEHAYYLDYQNARAKFVNAMWSIANWQFAESCYLVDEPLV